MSSGPVFDHDGWQQWLKFLDRAADLIAESAAWLNAINYFPVADSDTGTNLQLTLAGIRDEVRAASAELADPVDATDRESVATDFADRVVRAAVLSAHGNSGAIVAEMVVALIRTGPASCSSPSATTSHPFGHHLRSPCNCCEDDEKTAKSKVGTRSKACAEMLRIAAAAGRRAVARPVRGTILTVADAAAAGAAKAIEAGHSGSEGNSPEALLAVAMAARAAAADSLSGVEVESPVPVPAGVVDAGGQAYVLLLDVLIEALGGAGATPLVMPAEPVGCVSASESVEDVRADAQAGSYEVMYALSGVAAEQLAALREKLSVLGDSVVVVGDQTVAQVHVHLAEPGAAVEAGLAIGSMSQVRITALPAPARRSLVSVGTGSGSAPAARIRLSSRCVVAVVAGPGIGAAVTAHGGIAVLPAAKHITADELTGAIEGTTGELVILPNDMECLEIAGHLAVELRGHGRRVAVIPTVSQVQGLAALAVHDPDADFDSAVITMSSTAGHTRHAAVTVAEGPAMTMAGRCQTGDVLGLVEGDFVEIGADLLEVAWRVLERLLRSGGGELVTLVRGREAGPGLLEALTDRLRVREPGLDVEVIDGGQSRYQLLLGLA